MQKQPNWVKIEQKKFIDVDLDAIIELVKADLIADSKFVAAISITYCSIWRISPNTY